MLVIELLIHFATGVCWPASGLLAHVAGALAATAVLPGNRGPASGLLARGAGALAATVSLAGLLLGSWRMALEPWRPPTLR